VDQITSAPGELPLPHHMRKGAEAEDGWPKRMPQMLKHSCLLLFIEDFAVKFYILRIVCGVLHMWTTLWHCILPPPPSPPTTIPITPRTPFTIYFPGDIRRP